MANEDDKTTTIPTPSAPAARDYQTQVYQSLIELGASNPDALITASGDYWKHCQKLSIAPQVTAAVIYGSERHRHEVTRTTINEAQEPTLGLSETPPAAEAPKTAYRYADITFGNLADAQRFAGYLEKAASNIGVFVGGTRHGATVTTNAAPDVIAKTIKRHRWKGSVVVSDSAKIAAETSKDDVIARRNTYNGTLVQFWGNGDVTLGHEMNNKIVARQLPKELQLIIADDVSLYSDDEVKPLIAAARKAWDLHKREPHRVRLADVRGVMRSRAPAPKASEMPRGEGGIQSQIAAKTSPETCHTCIPWQKVARDPKLHADFAALAKKHGAIKTPLDVYGVVGADLNRETQEVFLVLALNIHSELMAPAYEVARGQRDRVAVGIDNVMDAASDARCAAFIVVHQHPGDTPTPSPADVKLTHDIRAATPPGRVFVDHVVVGSNSAYSITKKKLYKVK